TDTHAALVRGSSLATITAIAMVLVVAAPSIAQSADTPQDEPLKELVITGSRISTAGFDAPTPTTVVGVADLQQAGRTDLAQALADFPQFRMSQSAASTNTVVESGISPADLRGLGSARTLVLINN